MMKEEFEQLIGKEVSYDTFELYNSMYSVLPDKYTKQDFVNMLNVKEIPENPEAIERRKNKEELIKKYKQMIENKRGQIATLQQDTLYYKRLILEETDKDIVAQYRKHIKYNTAFIKQYRMEINEYKFIIA